MKPKSTYFYRHQAGGIVFDFAFMSKPTDAQLAPLRARMLKLHGIKHPKTQKEYWDAVIEVPTLTNEVPEYAEETGSGGMRTAEFGVSGIGTVKPR